MINTKSREDFNSDATTKIQIQYFGSIRVAVQKAEEEAELTAMVTVRQLLRRLVVMYGDALRAEIFEEGSESLRDDLMLTLNGAVLNHANAGDTVLSPGDKVALFPIFPGGG